jgi:hypothetical protein
MKSWYSLSHRTHVNLIISSLLWPHLVSLTENIVYHCNIGWPVCPCFLFDAFVLLVSPKFLRLTRLKHILSTLMRELFLLAQTILHNDFATFKLGITSFMDKYNLVHCSHGNPLGGFEVGGINSEVRSFNIQKQVSVNVSTYIDYDWHKRIYFVKKHFLLLSFSYIYPTKWDLLNVPSDSRRSSR